MTFKKVLVLISIIIFPLGILIYLYKRSRKEDPMKTFDIFDTDDWIGM